MQVEEARCRLRSLIQTAPSSALSLGVKPRRSVLEERRELDANGPAAALNLSYKWSLRLNGLADYDDY